MAFLLNMGKWSIDNALLPNNTMQFTWEMLVDSDTRDIVVRNINLTAILFYVYMAYPSAISIQTVENNLVKLDECNQERNGFHPDEKYMIVTMSNRRFLQ